MESLTRDGGYGSKSFCSKVLLFGEYNVIDYAMALSVPYHIFEGRLRFPSTHEVTVDSELKSFYQYLTRLVAENDMLQDFDISAFGFDVSQGLYFNSTIPRGFGVGSSGALCAAVYSRYSRNDCREDLPKLKKIFALMESYFHGSSSGMDPLISYLGDSILVKGKELFYPSIPSYREGVGGIFLINSGRLRHTAPLVNIFLEKMKNRDFKEKVENSLLPVTNDCIESFLQEDCHRLYSSFRNLSQFQREFFEPMIPRLFLDLWSLGLANDNFYLKLCGAGGGGFLLGMTKDFKLAKEYLSDYQVRLLYRF